MISVLIQDLAWSHLHKTIHSFDHLIVPIDETKKIIHGLNKRYVQGELQLNDCSPHIQNAFTFYLKHKSIIDV